jgi:transcription antitermination factor NusG
MVSVRREVVVSRREEKRSGCKQKGGALRKHPGVSTDSLNLDPVLQPAHWYAVYTRSHFERQAALEIAGRGIESYLPSYEEEHQWKDRKKRVALPLFPGYLFVRIRDVPPDRLSVLQARGVARIVGSPGHIDQVRDDEIDAVKRVLETRLACHKHPFLRAGMRVRVKRGPLEGLEGFLVRVKNLARLVISVNLIAQSVATEIDIADVQPDPAGKSVPSSLPARY